MPKSCPKHTAQDPHNTKEVNLGPTLRYTLCEKCQEDVDYIAKGMNMEWNDATSSWQARQNQPQPNQRPQRDDYDDEFEDDEDLDNGGLNPAHNPPNWNPNPVRNMGQGNRHIVLHNDNASAAHLVMEILRRVFNKDMMESNYIMQDAHYNGRATVFHCADDAEAQRFLDQIDIAKQDIANSGTVGANTLGNLQFTVEIH